MCWFRQRLSWPWIALLRVPVTARLGQRRRWGSGRPVLGERGELELVCRGARVLVGEEEGGIGDPARVGQRFRRDAGACGPVERLDAGVDDQQRDLDAVGAQL